MMFTNHGGHADRISQAFWPSGYPANPLFLRKLLRFMSFPAGLLAFLIFSCLPVPWDSGLEGLKT